MASEMEFLDARALSSYQQLNLFLVEVGATDVKVFELELNLARY